MKAIVCPTYGSPDVLGLEEVPKPVRKDNEVLVKVHAASVNAADWHLMRADPPLVRLANGLTKPKDPILGSDVAGRVKAVGKNVTRFKPGDEVFGDLSASGFGAFAEYVAAPEAAWVNKPAKLTFEQAAAVPMAAVTALQGLRDYGKIETGQKVLISGASGGVGTFAVQLAKSFGAEVTGVCSTDKVDLVRSLGADHVIDYKQKDFTRSDQRYDLILGVGGFYSLTAYKRALRPGGRYVMTGGETKQIFQALLLGPLISMRGDKKLTSFVAKPSWEDLTFISGLLESGEITPIIDKTYPLAEVPEAIRYLEAGRVRGKVVISVAQYGEA